MSGFSAIAEYQRQQQMNASVVVKGPEETEPQPEVERQPSTRARVGEDNNNSDPQYRSDENYHDSAPNQNWYANSGEKVEMPESSGSGPAPTPGTHFMAGDETAQMPERYEPKMSATPGTHYMAGDEAVKMPERRERKTSATPGTHYMAGDEAVTMPERREQKISVTPGSHFMAGEEKVADIHSNVSSQPSVAAPSGWFQAGGEKVQDGSDLRRIPQKSPNNKLAAPTGWFGCGAEAVSGSSNRSFASQKSDFKAQNFNGFEAVINSSPSASVYSRKSDVDGAGKEETPRSAQYARQQELMSRVAFNPNRKKSPSALDEKPVNNDTSVSKQFARAATKEETFKLLQKMATSDLSANVPTTLGKMQTNDLSTSPNAVSDSPRDSDPEVNQIRHEHFRQSLNLKVDEAAIKAVEEKYKYTLGKIEADLGNVPQVKKAMSVDKVSATPTEEELEEERIREKFRKENEGVRKEREERLRLAEMSKEQKEAERVKALEEANRIARERREANKVDVNKKGKYQFRYKNREGLNENKDEKYFTEDRAGALRARLARHFNKDEDNKKMSPTHQGSRLESHYAKLDTDVPLVKRQGTLKEEDYERPSVESQDMETPVDSSQSEHESANI